MRLVPALNHSVNRTPKFNFCLSLAVVILIFAVAMMAGCGSSGGSGSKVVAPSGLSYSEPNISATMNRAITANMPTVTGTVDAYAISPGMPAGLSLSSSSGMISGTPTAVSAKTSYTVTASNAAGSTTTTIQITVSQAAPTDLSYGQSSISGVVNQPIESDVPTVTGSVNSYASSPSLPLGLSIDPTTGVISGTPIDGEGTSPYTVTASNASGATSTTLQIGIALPPQSTSFMYANSVITTYVGREIVPDIPGIAGTLSDFTVTPDLPPGLTMDTTTGVISGIPTAVADKTTYVVSATSAGGSVSATVSPIITVTPAPNILLQLGNRTIFQLRFVNSNVLSVNGGQWMLWDYKSGDMLASGDAGSASFSNFLPKADMAGSTLAIAIPGGIQVRSALDGSILSTIVSPGFYFEGVGVFEDDSWQLASDGSYIAIESQFGIYIYSPGGQLICSRTGYYSSQFRDNPIFSAVPGQVQIANGPWGPNAVETIALPSGASSVSPAYQGQFQAWFTDGGRFITSDGTTVWTYSATGVLQAAVQIPIPINPPISSPAYPTFGGVGNWLWTFGFDSNANYAITFYKVGSASPSLSDDSADVAGFVASGTSIGILRNSAAFSVIDVSGATPSQADYTLPQINHACASTPSAGTFAAISSNLWVAGTGTVWGIPDSCVVNSSLLVDGASLSTGSPRYFGNGAALSIAGGTGSAAIATGSGHVYYFDPANTTLEGVIDLTGRKVELSSDGTVLAASSQDGTLLNTYSLPSGMLSDTLSYSSQSAPGLLSNFELSESGTTAAQVELFETNNSSISSLQVTPLSGSPDVLSFSPLPACQASFCPTSIFLSPDGTLAAVNSAIQVPANGGYSWNFSATIYLNGQQNAIIGGIAVGWIDNGRLLVNHYTTGMNSSYFGSTINGPTGNQLSILQLPEIRNIQPVNSDEVYSPDKNTIYSLTTGQATWTSPYGPDPGGAIAGPYVVYESGGKVIAVQY